MLVNRNTTCSRIAVANRPKKSQKTVSIIGSVSVSAYVRWKVGKWVSGVLMLGCGCEFKGTQA